MTRLERWWLRRLLAREVRQGVDHSERITALYFEVARACRQEFFEDGPATLRYRLRDLFLTALRQVEQEEGWVMSYYAPTDDQQQRWLLVFDDHRKSPEHFSDEGAEDAAKRAFENAAANWNCHLMCTAQREEG